MGAPLEDYKPGSIYVLKRCPPLHVGKLKKTKDRPVVVIRTLPAHNTIVIVAVTTSDEKPPYDQVQIPDKSVDPETGLDEPSAAIPQWYILVSPKRLGEAKIGRVPPELFLQIQAGVRHRMEAYFPPVQIDDEPAGEE